MSYHHPIRNTSSDKPVKTRVCDVIIDGDNVYLDFKTKERQHEIVRLVDVLKQIEEAKRNAKKS